MTRRKWLLVFAAALSMGSVGAALAETTLTMDENAPGEIDPGKGAGRAIAAILFYNIYDTLLLPGPGGSGFAPALAELWSQDGTASRSSCGQT